MEQNKRISSLTMRQLIAFFVPLGISASMVTASHSIINSTLARSTNPEFVIAGYAIAMSMLVLIERPALLLRQTCSALVRDKISFRAMTLITIYVLAYSLFMGMVIAYTPVGTWLLLDIMGIDEKLLAPVLQCWRFLMFVALFSGIRSLFHGVIIFNLRTKWLTIGMMVRLITMYLLSLLLIQMNLVHSALAGAWVFVLGMAIEALIAYFEGSKLLKAMPEKKEGHEIERRGQIFSFYRPLIYSTLLAVAIIPTINGMLGRTEQIALAIASFAIAANVAQLVQSFFSYMHQIVLNFYYKDTRKVITFAIICGFIPISLMTIVSYTPVGIWFLQSVMGIQGALLIASIQAVRVFIIMAIIFPWLDFCNGIVMLKGQTKIMVYSQAANVVVTLTTLLACISFVPHWNGAIGALAQSLGVAAELALVLIALNRPGISNLWFNRFQNDKTETHHSS